jgi:enoyl-CoA hydratase/carnithine racemase
MNETLRPGNTPLLARSDVEGVATLTLDRPAQFNALSAALLAELHTALTQIGADPGVRVVVIAGAGRAFCAGHDLKEIQAAGDDTAIRALFERCAQVMQLINALPQPVVARVHGVATAAGCQLVATCDLAMASTEARFATSGINAGLFCATPAVPLSRSMPRKQALSMLLTGEFISAQQALDYGLVNAVVAPAELDATVAALARTLCSKPRAAIAAGKRLFYQQAPLDLSAAYALATDSMVCGVLAPEGVEGIDAFVAKRAPHWPA